MMKKILLFIIVLFVSNIAIGQYTAAEVEAIEGRKVSALKPVRSDGFWQKNHVDGLYYNVPSVPMTTSELVEQTEELIAGGVYGGSEIFTVSSNLHQTDTVIATTFPNLDVFVDTTTVTDGNFYYSEFSIKTNRTVTKIGVNIIVAADAVLDKFNGGGIGYVDGTNFVIVERTDSTGTFWSSTGIQKIELLNETEITNDRKWFAFIAFNRVTVPTKPQILTYKTGLTDWLETGNLSSYLRTYTSTTSTPFPLSYMSNEINKACILIYGR